MQKTVDDFLNRYNLHTDIVSRFIDVVSEIGELGKEILTGSNYGKKNLDSNTLLKNEIGDCLFSLLALCCEAKISAGEALRDALKKYETRFEQKQSIGSE